MKQRTLFLAICLVILFALMPIEARGEGTVSWHFEESTGTLTISGTGVLENTLYSQWDEIREDIRCIVIGEGITEIAEEALWFQNMTTVSLPESLTRIGREAFVSCHELREVMLPKSVINIEAGAFTYCSNLTAFSVDPENPVYTAVDGVLFSLDEKTLVQCPGGYQGTYAVAQGVTAIGAGAFQGCGELTELILPDSVVSMGKEAFCSTGLTSVIIPDSIVRLNENIFFACEALREVTLPEGLKEIGSGAFGSCDSLNALEIPDSVTVVDSGAFYGCRSLKSLALPYGLSVISHQMFSHCSDLEEVVIPETVTKIEWGAFEVCVSLRGLVIPESVTEIEASAFSYCDALEMLVFLGDAPAIDEWAFDAASARIYYPSEAAGWAEVIDREFDGDVEWIPYTGNPPRLPGTLRVAGENRFLTAMAVAEQMKTELGRKTFDTIIVASSMNFADALSGSYLAAVKQAPILLACGADIAPAVAQQYNALVADYIRENLSENGTVYILGGPVAVSPSMEEALTGCPVVRLAGSNRYETNIRILEEAGAGDREVLICSGDGFADSLSASAAELPILLVSSKLGLLDVQKAFLENCESGLCIIGGTGAVSGAVEKQLEEYGKPRRLGGKNRFETSAKIAEEFFAHADTVVLAYGWNFPDGLCGGSLAAALDCPLLLTMENWEKAAKSYVASREILSGMVLGTGELIGEDSLDVIFAK